MKLKSYLWSLLALLALSVSFTACSDDDDDVKDPTPGPDTPTELSFQLNVSNISAHAADLEIIPSNNEETYYADLLEASEIAGLSTDQQIIDYITPSIEAGDEVSGRQFIPAAFFEDLPLNAETEYVLFALGCKDGKVTTKKIAVKHFTTLAEGQNPEPQPEQGPEVSLTGAYLAETGEIAYTVKCLSHDAASAAYVVAPQAMIDEILAESSMDQLLAEGQPFAEDWIAALNMETGLRLAVGKAQGVEAGQTWTMIVEVKNAENGRTVKRADCKAEGTAPEPEGPITLLVEGYAGDRQGQNGDKYISLYMQCPTKNAVSAYYVFGGTTLINEMISESSVEAFVSEYGQNLTDLIPSAVNELNGDAPFMMEVGPESGITPNTSFSWYLKASDAEGHTTIKWVDIKTEAASTAGAPMVEMQGYITDANKIAFAARCTSQDASSARIAILDKAEYDRFRGAGNSFTDLMDAVGDGATQFAPEWLTYLNSTDGISLDVTDYQEGLVLGAVLEVLNENGGKTFRYADNDGGQDGEMIGGSTDVDPEKPEGALELYMDGSYNYEEGRIFLTLQCVTGDATEGYVAILPTSALEPMLQSYTLEQVVGMAIDQGAAAILAPEQLEALNGQGLTMQADDTMGLQDNEKYSFLLLVRNIDGASNAAREDVIYGTAGIEESLVYELSHDEFKQKIWDYTSHIQYEFAGSKATVLEFGATWCSGCQFSLPVLEKLAKEYEGRVEFYSSDVDNDPQSYQMMGGLVEGSGIPLIFFIDANGKYTAVRGVDNNMAAIEKLFRQKVEAIVAVEPEVKPEPNPQPEAGPLNYTLSGKCVEKDNVLYAQLTMQCLSQDCSKASYIWAEKMIFDKYNKGYDSLEAYLDDQWLSDLTAEQLAAFNSTGFVYEYGEDTFFIADKTYTFVLDAHTADGVRKAKRCDLLAVKNSETPDPELPDGPQIDGELVVDGWAGDIEHKRPFDHITFNIKFPGAVSGKYFLTDAKAMDGFESDGYDAITQHGYDFVAKQMQQIKSAEGLYINAEYLPEATAALAYRLVDSKGEVKEGRYDIKLESLVEGDGPTIYVEMEAGDPNGQHTSTDITAGMSCISKNAVMGRFNLFDTESLDQNIAANPNFPIWKIAMQGGNRIENVPDYGIKDLDIFNGVNEGSILGFTTSNLQPNTGYTMLVIAYDINGVYTVERADCKTSADGKSMLRIMKRYENYTTNANKSDLIYTAPTEPEVKLYTAKMVPTTKFTKKLHKAETFGRTWTKESVVEASFAKKMLSLTAKQSVKAEAMEVALVASLDKHATLRDAETEAHAADVVLTKGTAKRVEAQTYTPSAKKQLRFGRFLK